MLSNYNRKTLDWIHDVSLDILSLVFSILQIYIHRSGTLLVERVKRMRRRSRMVCSKIVMQNIVSVYMLYDTTLPMEILCIEYNRL